MQGIPILGTQDELSRIVKAKNIDEVIISIQKATKDQMKKIIIFKTDRILSEVAPVAPKSVIISA